VKLCEHILKFVLLALLLTPSSISAQTATTLADDWSAVKNTPSGERLSVTLKDGRTLKGTLSDVSDLQLTLSNKGKFATIEQEVISEIYRISGRSRARSALIGASVGAGVGAAFGGSFVNASLDDTARNRGRNVLGGAVTGAGIFGGLGALVGYALGNGQKRVLIYQAK
jgi:hypothetical protein